MRQSKNESDYHQKPNYQHQCPSEALDFNKNLFEMNKVVIFTVSQ